MPNRNERNYYCMNCEEFFGDIPAFGCPFCGSENYYSVSEINIQETIITGELENEHLITQSAN